MKKIFLLSLALVAVTGIAMADHADVVAADKLLIENYTIPSYIPMWVAREAARKDPSTENLAALKQAVEDLKSKYEPYCVVANIKDDPRYNMAFAWFTNEGVEQGQVELTDEEGNITTIEATPTTTRPLRYACSGSQISPRTGMPNTQTYVYVSHKAQATGLKAGTTYSYRVGYESHWSNPFSFTTAEEEQGDFSFVYMTDAHIVSQTYVDKAELCATAAMTNEKDLRFCVFPGDFVETGTAANSEWEWERWFEESLKPVIAQMPIVPTDGNHDDSPNINYTYHFNTDNTFNTIASVKPQFQGITYSFVYGDVLFLVFSMQDFWRGKYSYKKGTSTYLQTDVANWFIDQIEAHPECKWRVGLVHKNLFSGSDHATDEETAMLRATMLPIMNGCDIDLVLQGHDHCYEVIGPVDPWTRTIVPGSVTDTLRVKVDKEKNRTGLEGGTFCTDEGTLYFIGATCGNKRYYPHSRATMEQQESVTKVKNYFDLFTSKFGQPGTPSYTRVNVTADTLELKTYAVTLQGASEEFNTIHVIRTKEHVNRVSLDQVRALPAGATGVYDLMGNRYDKIPGSGMYIVVNKEGTKKIHVQ